MFDVNADYGKGDKSRKSRRGSAAVELAIILPILIVLLFGIVEFGLMLYDKAVITNASREGARYGILFRNPGQEVTCSDITGVITAYTANNLVTFGSDASVNTDYPLGCSPPSGSDLTVKVTFHYDYLVLPGFVGSLAGPVSLVGQTTMVKE